jgi:hypothetical protein
MVLSLATSKSLAEALMREEILIRIKSLISKSLYWTWKKSFNASCLR